MPASPDESQSPLDAFLVAVTKDRAAGALRPLADYLARFPGDEDGIAQEYFAHKRGGSAAPSANRIAHYRKIRQIGRGGQGTVYLAEDTHLHRQVALKIMDPGFASDAIAVERFKREAEITSKLDHPGICTVYETGEDRGARWIAMRYVEGEPLVRKITAAKEGYASGSASTFVVLAEPGTGNEAPAASPPPTDTTGPKTWADISRLLLLFEDAARALHAAHEVGVIHRDIKPGNMMVTTGGKPVILDFGMAVDTDSDQPTLTMTGDLMGTKEYMSPEQIAAHRITLDRRTDVYSLGVSLFECLALRRPFEAPTREGLYEAIMTKAPPDLRVLNPALPADLRVVVATAIEKERDRRYQTALDLAEELRRVRMHEPIVAKPVGPLVRLARWGQRNPALATMTGGLFLALSVGLVVTVVLLGKVTIESTAKTTALNEKQAALIQVTTERNEKEAARSSLAASVSDYDRLGDLSRLQKLVAEADRLWPAEPSRVAAMNSWVDQASYLEMRLAGHREVRDRLRTSARESSAEQFKHDTTAKLVADLTAFVNPDPHKGLLADVRGRLAFAESVQRETIGKYETKWADAIRSIADKKECPNYHGLTIRPQPGLIPIDRDPKSGLWEFVHLQTVAPGTDPIPKRDKDSHLVVTEDMGIVFVLLPGGTFRMGAVKEPPDEDTPISAPNVDPEAAENEGPVTEVTLEPFFLSKYEMTQGQWLRLVGKNPSQYGPGSDFGGKVVDLRHPLEQVAWNDCDLWLGRLGLILPTEAQWEFAARGGTTTPRWTGVGTDGLGKAANLSDAFARQNGGPPDFKYEAWNDGYTVHAPAGSFSPNPFGLHDMLGNVWEWCRDWFGRYEVPASEGDGLRSPSASRGRVYRGGGFNFDASVARSALRNSITPENRGNNLGVRPARRLDP